MLLAGSIFNFSCRLFIFSRIALRCFSSSFTVIPCLFIALIVLSAYSFASLSMRAASSLAFLIILSVRSSRRSVFLVSSDFNWAICALYSFNSSRSRSIVTRLCSRSVTRSSNLISSESRRREASLIILSESPSFLEMANALLFPGTPIRSL